MKLPKLVIMGYARHGKDTVCEYLVPKYGYTFVSSSRFVLEKAVWPAMKDRFPTMEAAYEGRGPHRAEWFRLISAYNDGDPARLGRELFNEYEIYAGIRNAEEFAAMRAENLFDYAIWVDASKRLPPEPPGSCTVRPDMADFVLDNNGPLDALPAATEEVLDRLGFPKTN